MPPTRPGRKGRRCLHQELDGAEAGLAAERAEAEGRAAAALAARIGLPQLVLSQDTGARCAWARLQLRGAFFSRRLKPAEAPPLSLSLCVGEPCLAVSSLTQVIGTAALLYTSCCTCSVK